MTAVVLRGDARRLPLPDGCVDLIVTSPPYFSLRSYVDTVKCYECIQMEYAGRDPRQAWPDYDAHVREVHLRHYDGQIGSEATPQEWVAALVACTAEWVRVLKPSGSIFVNLGDKFAGSSTSGPPSSSSTLLGNGHRGGGPKIHNMPAFDRPPLRMDAPAKSLLGLPWRYALACMDQTLPYVREQFLAGLLSDVLDGIVTHDQARRRLAEFDASPKSKGLGLILRRDIIWSKPNGLPESVTDRCRSSHEYLFHFTVQPRYYAAVDEIRESYAPGTAERYRSGYKANSRGSSGASSSGVLLNMAAGDGGPDVVNPLGKLPGSVWTIPSQPLTVPARLGVDHFAAFPMELPRRCVLGWSPPGVCTACGEGRRPVSERPSAGDFGPRVVGRNRQRQGVGPPGNGLNVQPTTITGYACACPEPDAPVRPALVVDPFGGTGCTALVAAAYGRTGVSVDLSGDYCRLARWRTTDPAERAKALQVPKPPPVPDGQGSLFDEAS